MNNSADAVTDLVLGIWKDSTPTEAYAAGFENCEGRLPMTQDSARASLTKRIEEVNPRLAEIENEDLRFLAKTILKGIEIDCAFERPDKHVLLCFVGLWAPFLKNQQTAGFVDDMLEQAIEILEYERNRWQAEKFSGEVIKATSDACNSLSFILTTLKDQKPGSLSLIEHLEKELASFKGLFPFSVKDPQDFTELFAFFEANSQPAEELELYPRILSELFDFGADAATIADQSAKALKTELELARQLLPRLSDKLSFPADAGLGDAYTIMTQRYEIESVLDNAQKMMGVINVFIDRYVQDLGVEPNIMPLEAPPYLRELITSGATVPLDWATSKPKSLIYINSAKTASWLTLLNVLVHEASHAYHPLLLAGDESLPMLAKLKASFSIPFSEATAFHREWELFEAVSEQSTRGKSRNSVQQALIDLFDTPKYDLPDDVAAFEFETRYWRMARALRTLCDVQVNTGQMTYVEFLKDASRNTGLTASQINNECLTFLSSPGYMPSYTFCGTQYEDIEKHAAGKGMTKLSFNTRANRMGLWPWTVCVSRMKRF